MSKTFFSFLISCSLILPLLGVRLVDVSLVSGLSAMPAAHSQLAATYDALPLNFELNQGQTHQRVKFLARSEGYVLFLTATEAVMALDNPATHKKGKENRNDDFEMSQRR